MAPGGSCPPLTARLEVLRAGPLTTVQDGGRRGHRSAGVSPSGFADRTAAARANRLVGNPGNTALLEVTLGGLILRARGSLLLAISGARCTGAPFETPLALGPGDILSLGGVGAGLRTYVAVRGGIDVPAVLGSRSTDTLSGLGPAPLRTGDELPVGAAATAPAGAGDPPAPVPGDGREASVLTLLAGPRDDWLDVAGWASLTAQCWTVGSRSNRVAVRLEGEALPVRAATLEPEPLVRGAVQLPPSGQPILFLADHPVTGGYPVVGVLTGASADGLAQCRPGHRVRLMRVAPSGQQPAQGILS